MNYTVVEILARIDILPLSLASREKHRHHILFSVLEKLLTLPGKTTSLITFSINEKNDYAS